MTKSFKSLSAISAALLSAVLVSGCAAPAPTTSTAMKQTSVAPTQTRQPARATPKAAPTARKTSTTSSTRTASTTKKKKEEEKTTRVASSTSLSRRGPVDTTQRAAATGTSDAPAPIKVKLYD
ncbi:hypothetical protein [Sulfitobacter sp. R18_1]|uniref:hypothetical protein n=1 Tax=Sulfitobacter sp. R18_1 TaxID=2821104 RepID=UPI001ADC301C|nr:hypothetical protein [Sulfitobacter sp. R18_1]MBO9428851.1 hypothetical protein [Sulfitobacter sp. R18_1]